METLGNTFTVVNELPLEEYLLGVVPNELSPTTFGEIEALKAQAVAARTYIVRNLGQYKNEGYDICASDSCQVCMGRGTENSIVHAGGDGNAGHDCDLQALAHQRALQLNLRWADRGCREYFRREVAISRLDDL